MKLGQHMHFDTQGLPNLTTVIEKSLVRSASYGIDPDLDGAPEVTRLSATRLQERLERHAEFYAVACRELDSLYSLLKNTGFCSALTDHEGYVLYVVGDADLMEHFRRRRYAPGYRWTERDVGTCAIGLVLEERIPVFIPGEKMFALQAQKISNAGAPVFSPDGNSVLGVLCLSGFSEKMHVHTLGLVRQSADRISSVLRERKQTRELEIQNQYMKAIIESHSRGLVTVDCKGHIVQMNRKAGTLLQASGETKGQDLAKWIDPKFDIEAYLENGRRLRPREIVLKNGAAALFASLDPIRTDTGELVGWLITLIEKDELMRIATEMAGSQAHFTFDAIIGESEKMKAALHLARISAGSTVSVLLSGETGTGKELFAQAIHNASDRCNDSFVAINCGAIPRELFESELFGCEEGAFTGATRGGRPGKIELAHRGTLFLDEIGDIPIDLQVKLLRVLQGGELQRVGGTRSYPIDLRIISATNVDLEQAIREQKFRQDLFYRICTLQIHIPPLRERPKDILMLAHHFLKRHEVRFKRKIIFATPEVERVLVQYDWPGNVRQLENAVERAVHIAQGADLLPDHFGITSGVGNARGEGGSSCFSGKTMVEIERRVLIETLKELNGNIRQASLTLGISRPTLYRKLKQYRLYA